MTQLKVGKLEHRILEQLWRLGEATVVDIHAALASRRSVAPTTVSTILRRLEDKGLVTHRTEARRFVFRACVERRELRRSMIGDLVDQLFGGSTAALMSHLLEEGDIDARELERLRRSIGNAASRRTAGRRTRGGQRVP